MSSRDLLGFNDSAVRALCRYIDGDKREIAFYFIQWYLQNFLHMSGARVEI